MERNETVKQLRALAADRKGEVMQLPSEFVNIINGVEIEQKWCHVGVDKALSYFADMLEV